MKIKLLAIVLMLSLLAGVCISCSRAEPKQEPSTTAAPTDPVDTSAVQDETPTEPIPTSVVNEEQESAGSSLEAPPAVGGTDLCREHYWEYHDFDGALIDYVGRDEFFAWVDSLPRPETVENGECCVPGETLKAWIDHFQIPRDKFEDAYIVGHICVHNFDLLYSDDLDAVEAYYRDVDKRQATHDKQEMFNLAKNAIIIDHLNVSEIWESGTEEEKRRATAELCSIFELVREHNVTRSELKAYLADAKNNRPYDVEYNYNLDVIYNEDGTLKPYDESKKVYELDAIFCGVDNYFTD